MNNMFRSDGEYVCGIASSPLDDGEKNKEVPKYGFSLDW